MLLLKRLHILKDMLYVRKIIIDVHQGIRRGGS